MIASGGAALLYSALTLPLAKLDARLLVLAALTLCVTSRVAINIPGDRAKISVSDTFVFLALLLYGGAAATIIAAAEAFISSFYSTKTNATRLFNAATMAVSTLLTATTLRLAFGDGLGLSEGFTANFVTAVCTMAFVHRGHGELQVLVGHAGFGRGRVCRAGLAFI